MDHLKIMEYFPKRIAVPIENVAVENIEEIRLRAGQMIEVRRTQSDLFLPCAGDEPLIGIKDCQEFLENICFHSVYACENQLRSGFITVPGGFRIGLGGKVLMENGHVLRIDTPVSFCIRIARECIGCAASAIRHLIDENSNPLSTLVISPPGCGKTTMLRDITRIFSSGTREIAPRHVCVIDERSEVAGCSNGIPQLNLGPRCDVLDNCTKAEGIMLALRALAPEVIICDELGTDDDCDAVVKALSGGCAVFASLHGDSLEAFRLRFNQYSDKLFSRYLILSRKKGPGTVETVYDSAGNLVRVLC